MKLIVVIVQDQDVNRLMTNLSENRFQFTKIGSTGGFLREGNTTLLIGVGEKNEEEVLSIIKKNCQSRQRPDVMARHVLDDVMARHMLDMEGDQPSENITVTVGGATVFVIKVEKSESF